MIGSATIQVWSTVLHQLWLIVSPLNIYIKRFLRFFGYACTSLKICRWGFLWLSILNVDEDRIRDKRHKPSWPTARPPPKRSSNPRSQRLLRHVYRTTIILLLKPTHSFENSHVYGVPRNRKEVYIFLLASEFCTTSWSHVSDRRWRGSRCRIYGSKNHWKENILYDGGRICFLYSRVFSRAHSRKLLHQKFVMTSQLGLSAIISSYCSMNNDRQCSITFLTC